MTPAPRAPPLTLIRTSLAGLALPGQSLRAVAAPLDFDEVDAAQRRAIVNGLLAAMYAPPGGVGLAATMAGLDLRLVIATHGGRVLTMVNPEVVATGGPEVAMTEGNLCLPGVRGEVVRPSTVTVRWVDVHASEHEESFDGRLARILFHELELLDGHFFTDHVARAALTGLGDGPHPLNVLTMPPKLHRLRRSVLRRPASAVHASAVSPRALAQLIEALQLTMRASRAAALAAPQVGIGLRLAVVDDREHDPLTLIDATVVDRSEQTESAIERCSSFPGFRGPIARARRIRVHNHTTAGDPYELDAEGNLARLIQHAIDHFDGVTFLPDAHTEQE